MINTYKNVYTQHWLFLLIAAFCIFLGSNFLYGTFIVNLQGSIILATLTTMLFQNVSLVYKTGTLLHSTSFIADYMIKTGVTFLYYLFFLLFQRCIYLFFTKKTVNIYEYIPTYYLFKKIVILFFFIIFIAFGGIIAPYILLKQYSIRAASWYLMIGQGATLFLVPYIIAYSYAIAVSSKSFIQSFTHSFSLTKEAYGNIFFVWFLNSMSSFVLFILPSFLSFGYFQMLAGRNIHSMFLLFLASVLQVIYTVGYTRSYAAYEKII